METECSLPYSQEPATFPYLILNNPVYALPSCFFKINYNIFPCMPVSFIQVSLQKPRMHNLFSAVHVLCPLRLILFDLMTRIVFGVGNKPRSYAWLQTSAAKKVRTSFLLRSELQ
jgi:hypothetical protein